MNQTKSYQVQSVSSNGKFKASLINEEQAKNDSNENIFLNYVIPEEVIAVREGNDGYEVENIIKKSPFRVDPFCKYFKTCGGCQLQHIDHKKQIEYKIDFVNSFGRHFKTKNEEGSGEKVTSNIFIKDFVVGSSKNYRNRVNLHILNGKIGYYKQHSREIIEIDECGISHSLINSVIKNLKPLGDTFKGVDSSLSLETDGERIIAVLKIPLEIGEKKLDEIKLSLAKIFENFVIFIKRKKVFIKGKDELGFEITEFIKKTEQSDTQNKNSIFINFPSGAFSQVNPEINKELINEVLKIVEQIKPSTIEDLYAGAGNFSVPLALNGYKVVAVESEAELTGLGDKNAIRLGVNKTLSFYNMSVEKYLGFRQSKEVDLVIVDPPRIGLLSVAKKLNYAKNVILISCKVESFMKDTKELTGERGQFEIKSIKSFDMFPHTQHLELLTWCVRK